LSACAAKIGLLDHVDIYIIQTKIIILVLIMHPKSEELYAFKDQEITDTERIGTLDLLQ
ncbi:hypothetical protein ACJX0J_025012, partial [Zea mays]